MKYRKRPVVIEAVQWFKAGDHPAVNALDLTAWDAQHHDCCVAAQCDVCRTANAGHGWVNTLEAGHRVCPGDWIITGVKGELYPCKPDIFALTYEVVE